MQIVAFAFHLAHALPVQIIHCQDSMKNPVRMQEIASAAKLSVATVSRALNNHPAIPKKTRVRVQKVARKLGYRPNAMIGALMAQIRSRKPAVMAYFAFIRRYLDKPLSSDMVQVNVLESHRLDFMWPASPTPRRETNQLDCPVGWSGISSPW